VEPENPQALAEAILRLYQDSEQRELYGRRGRQYAMEHLSRDACVAKYEALFQEAVRNYPDKNQKELV
jgi:colanic acid biosynthesis glycosyl transferase WcaI